MGRATAPRIDAADRMHGEVVCDPYRWLEDSGNPLTRAWTAFQEEEFSGARAAWAHVEDWHDLLRRVADVAISSPPSTRGTRSFATRLAVGADHPVLIVSEGGEERALIDLHVIDPAGDTVLETWHPSIEGDLLAYQLSSRGSEECALRVLDVTTGDRVGHVIDRVVKSPIAWLPGGAGFYYVRQLPNGIPGEDRYDRRVYLHRLGTDPEEDALIFGEGRGRTQFYGLSVTADGRWLTISATAGTAPSNELWLADLLDGGAERPDLRPIHIGGPARSSVRILPGTTPCDPIWLRTTLGAPRGRVVATSAADPGSATWRTVIAERPDAVLVDFEPLMVGEPARPAALLTWRRHAISEITLHDLDGGGPLDTVWPYRGTVGPLTTTPEHTRRAWFTYTDYVTPPQVVTVVDGVAEDGRPTAAGGGMDCVVTRVVTVTSHDGTPVRLFIVAPCVRPDVPRPAILTGYGGFGQSMVPQYLPYALAWVRSGGVFAVACLRGGGEEGREWHQAGMSVRRQRVFDDFDAATDHLIDNGWTSPNLLGIFGQSNGGLLVAAALTQHPEKYGAVACVAPLTDMIRYERSGMGPSWRTEYGSVQNSDEFRALLAYSPYHRVTQGTAYPPVMIAAFDADSRVDPAHARKMTAALQFASTGTAPIVYRRERDAGHGARSTSRTITVLGDILGFFGHHLGLKPVTVA